MNKRAFLSMAVGVAAALAASPMQAYALGVENSNTNANSNSTTASSERSSRQSADASLGGLFTSALWPLAPAFGPDGDRNAYYRQALMRGWSPDQLTLYRAGETPSEIHAYFQRRIADLKGSRAPNADLVIAAAERALNTSGEQEQLQAMLKFAFRETAVLAALQAFSPLYPDFQVTFMGSGNFKPVVLQREFHVGYMPGVMYHAEHTLALMRYLHGAMEKKGPMTHAARMRELVRLMFDDATPVMFARFDPDRRGVLTTGRVGSAQGYMFQSNGWVYATSERGMEIYANGNVYFNSDRIAGVSVTYADAASNTNSRARSSTKTNSTGTRNATITR